MADPNEESPDRCAVCDTAVIETTGEARKGGGYHRRCENGHEWDDPRWSYMKKALS